uniref:Uncharacterized protein n=1 Tax=Romanomermis culicivorax TaxID=13658 RepID=A0A915I2F1_ROMCU
MMAGCFACLLVVVCMVTDQLWTHLVHSTTSGEASSGQIDSPPAHHPSSSPKTAYNYDPPDLKEDENNQRSGGFLALNSNGKDDVEAIEFYLEMRLFQSGINQIRKEKIVRNNKTSGKANSSHL